MRILTNPIGPIGPTGPTTHQGTRVAVIGAGISGLSAAYGLHQGGANVTLFESGDRLGGHANTVDAQLSGGQSISVDTGFIVYNELNYPNLVGLFEEIGVETAPSDMSFAASFNNGQFEYSGSGAAGLLARRRNVTSPIFWSMMTDLIRFYRTAPQLFEHAAAKDMTLGAFMKAHRFGPAFTQYHLLPMAAAIWSSPMMAMEDYPVETFLRFFCNHGLLSLGDRPPWRTVKNGSRNYVSKIAQHIGTDIRLNSQIKTIQRCNRGVNIVYADGSSERFDACILATAAPQALDLIADPTVAEQAVLGAFSTHANEVVLHQDRNFMPRRKRAWASWNYIARNGATIAQQPGAMPCLTYWMNNLQPLPTDQDVFVTLNPDQPLDDSKVLGRFSYNHPAFDRAAITAQTHMPAIQGKDGLWFAGAWMGYGFHEDGAESGFAVAEALTSWRRPWSFDSAKARIPGNVLAQEPAAA